MKTAVSCWRFGLTASLAFSASPTLLAQGGLTTNVWKTSLTGPLSESSPAVAGGQLYYGSQQAFYQLDGASGDVKWTQQSVSSLPTCSPAVNKTQVFAVNGKAGAYHAARLVAMDRATGRPLWEGATDDLQMSPVANDDVVVVSDLHKVLSVLTASDGKVRWQANLDAEIHRGRSPLIVGGRLFVGTLGGTVTAYDLATGHVQWTVKAPAGVLTSLVAAGEALIFSVTDDDQTGYDHDLAIAQSDGHTIWDKSGYSHREGADPVVMGGLAYFADVFSPCEIRARRLTDGTEAWTTTVGFFPTSMTAAGGLLYLSGGVADTLQRSNRVAALDAASGGVSATSSDLGAGNGIWMKPTALGSLVVIGVEAEYQSQNDGLIQALR